MPARKGTKAASGEQFVSRRAFAAIVDGRTILIQPGQVIDANDPVYKGREALFEPFTAKVRNYGQVEQATAAPGEKRA